jgi:hypothetical protein
MWGKDEEKLTDAGVMPTQKAAFKQLRGLRSNGTKTDGKP